jgi:hypothetical protein
MKQRGGSVLGKKTILKSDHFPGCQNKRLSPQIDGAPNYRQVLPSSSFLSHFPLSLPRPSMLLDIFLLLSYLVYCFIFHFFFRLFVRRFLFIYMCCSSLTYIPIVHRINFTLSCISLVGNGAFVWGPNSWNSVFFFFRKKVLLIVMLLHAKCNLLVARLDTDLPPKS